jgi:hypothetical protein
MTAIRRHVPCVLKLGTTWQSVDDLILRPSLFLGIHIREPQNKSGSEECLSVWTQTLLADLQNSKKFVSYLDIPSFSSQGRLAWQILYGFLEANDAVSHGCYVSISAFAPVSQGKGTRRGVRLHVFSDNGNRHAPSLFPHKKSSPLNISYKRRICQLLTFLSFCFRRCVASSFGV